MLKHDVSSRHEMIARWFFLIVSVAVGYIFWRMLQPYAIVLITAAATAVVVTPLEPHARFLFRNRRLSAFLMVLGVLVVIVGPLVLAGFLMVDQALELVRSSVGAHGWIETFDVTHQAWFTILPQSLQSQISTFDVRSGLLALASWASQHLGVIFASSADFVFKTAMFFICLFYFILDRDRIVDEILALSPLKNKTDRDILDRMANTIRAVVSGSLIVAIIQGVLAAVGMTIFGIPGALIWAALVVIAANIPFLGTASIMLPAVAYLVISGNNGGAIGLLIWSVVVVGFIDNVLKPYLVEGRTNMHALLILLTILGGLQVFGPIGLIVGPTILAAFLALVELYKAGVLEKKNI